MDFKDVQKYAMKNALRYGQAHGVAIDKDFSVLKLYEEVGELAQAVLIHNKKSRPEKFVSVEESKNMIAQELADVVGMCLVNAELFDIDLEEAIDKKWLAKVKK